MVVVAHAGCKDVMSPCLTPPYHLRPPQIRRLSPNPSPGASATLCSPGLGLPAASLVGCDGQRVLEAAHQRLHLPAAVSHGAHSAGRAEHVTAVAALLHALRRQGGGQRR